MTATAVPGECEPAGQHHLPALPLLGQPRTERDRRGERQAANEPREEGRTRGDQGRVDRANR